jgi:type VI secretion system secreted protein Hcp
MAIETHIRFDGVEGESTHADHKGEIELLAWAWSVHNTRPLPGGGSGTGKAAAGELTFTHAYDKASPVLAKKCAQGVHFKEVAVTARKSGEGQRDFLRITMREVFVTSVAPSGSVDGGIAESVSLAYGAIDFSYSPQDSTGGLGGEVRFGWDVKTNRIT